MIVHRNVIALGVALVAMLALLAGCGGAQPTNTGQGSTPGPVANGPRIALDEDSFDFGKVPLDKLVSKSFKIRNVGSEPLVILGEPPVRAAQGC